MKPGREQMLFCMMHWNAASESCGCWKSTYDLGHLGGLVEEKLIRGVYRAMCFGLGKA